MRISATSRTNGKTDKQLSRSASHFDDLFCRCRIKAVLRASWLSSPFSLLVPGEVCLYVSTVITGAGKGNMSLLNEEAIDTRMPWLPFLKLLNPQYQCVFQLEVASLVLSRMGTLPCQVNDTLCSCHYCVLKRLCFWHRSLQAVDELYQRCAGERDSIYALRL